MLIGRVIGNVVSTQKCAALFAARLLIVKPVDLITTEETGDYVIAIDALGAGEGELVMCVFGSSSKFSDETEAFPSDMSILAILDSISVDGNETYTKGLVS